MRRFARFFLRNFLRGVLYTVPLAIILYILFALLKSIDGLIFNDYTDVVVALTGGKEVLIEDARLIDRGSSLRYIPGLGILILIIIITTVGYFGSTILAQPIKAWFHRMLDRAPLIKTIYSSINDLLSAFVGKKKGFDQPVLVKLSSDMDVQKLGFITKTDLSKLGIGVDKVAVYLPHSFNFSGNLFIVPEKNVTPLDVSSAHLMKFIVSGGVTEIEKE